jgi:hypothetical protein
MKEEPPSFMAGSVRIFASVGQWVYNLLWYCRVEQIVGA